ncbi:MAG: AAA family ATPase [Lachnospiraceae bacterium]|nr:AAA family ATPase [Lachnospiraceae bacterium]
MSAFDKIIGYEDIKAELKRFADYLKNPEKYKKLGVSFPSGILLHGDPGLGKSLMAKCFIEESGVKCFTLRKEKPNGDFVNQIKETYESAKKEAVSIVFLDDLDKFANEDVDHTDAEEYVSVQSCIDDSKEFGVFTIATANDKYRLPDSLVRAGRFDKVIQVEYPKGKYSEDIVRHYLEGKQTLGNIDIEEIARFLEERSCAEIESVINEAGIYAAYSGKEMIEQEDLIKACMRLLFDMPECINPEEDENTYSIAVHEAGHATVAEVLNPGSVTLVTVFKRPHNIGGFAQYKNPSQYYTSKELQEHVVIRNLGGKAATELITGLTDVGCNKDLGCAYEIVEDFVDDYCSYGFETFEGGNPSEWLLKKKDRLIAAEVEKYYQVAKTIISENRELYDAVLEALLDHMTVTYREMREIKDRVINPRPKSKEIKRKMESYLCPQYTFERYNINEQNRLAYTAALGVAYNPSGMYNPLILCGDNGTGKTHLLNAIGNYICMLNFELTVLCMPAKKFISAMNEHAEEGSSWALEEYKDVDVLLFDDFELLAGNEAALNSFTDMFLDIHEKGKQIVIAMNCLFSHLEGVPDKTIKILNWGNMVEITQ